MRKFLEKMKTLGRVHTSLEYVQAFTTGEGNDKE